MWSNSCFFRIRFMILSDDNELASHDDDQLRFSGVFDVGNVEWNV